MEQFRFRLHLWAVLLSGAISLLGTSCGKVDEASLTPDDDELGESVSGCGVERWSVKTGTDPDVATVNQVPMSSTISTLIGFRPPATLPPNNRINPQERETFRLQNVTLVSYKLENDSDYHLVISDGSRTMISEIPIPGCVGAGSPFASAIRAARAAFDARFHATTSFQTANIPATITGVGFFDFLHGQTGVAPNGFELHPVLSICFGTDCAAPPRSDFSLAVTPSSRSVSRGSSTTYSVTTAVTSGSAQSIRLSISGLPAGASAAFSPALITAGGTSTLTITVARTAGIRTSNLTLAATGASATHTATAVLAIR